MNNFCDPVREWVIALWLCERGLTVEWGSEWVNELERERERERVSMWFREWESKERAEWNFVIGPLQNIFAMKTCSGIVLKNCC